MATACIAQSTLQVHGISKPIIARFDQLQASSDGGAVLLKLIDDRLGLTWRLASTLRNGRQPGKVTHALRDLVRQRVFGIACGYADCNDAARLVGDPIQKLPLERDPFAGAALGSQPTLSRFENAVGRADLYRLGTALVDTVLLFHRERLGDRVRLITIDLDATDDPTQGRTAPASSCSSRSNSSRSWRRSSRGRGDMENRLKELQHGMAMDRTSCSRFAANQLRLLVSVAAYVLFQAL